MSGYEYPHESEGESLHRLMERLTPKQQRALRSYVRLVLFGDLSVADWLRTAADAPALSTWYKPDGNYIHGADFLAALKGYRDSYSGWVTGEERKAVEAASRTIRLAANRAAAHMVALMTQAGNETVQFNAAKDILNRADASIAEKSQMTVRSARDLSDEELAAIVDTNQTDER